MNFKDLFTDHNGKLSHTRLWSNIAYGAATVIVLWYAYKLQLSWDMFLSYLGVVGSATAVSKLFDLRYGITPPAPKPPVPGGVK